MHLALLGVTACNTLESRQTSPTAHTRDGVSRTPKGGLSTPRTKGRHYCNVYGQLYKGMSFMLLRTQIVRLKNSCVVFWGDILRRGLND